MVLNETGWRGMYWTDLTRYREQWRAIVSKVMGKWVS
jgi:hypothetical protein